MHLTHLPQTLLLLLLLPLTHSTLARPEPHPDQTPLSSNENQILLDPRSAKARHQRLEAWKAQKPMHTTALLAGAAATAVSESRLKNGRRRDLSCITGEKGIWMPAEFWDEGDGVEKERGAESGGLRGEKEVNWERDVGLDLEDEHGDVYGKMESTVYGARDAIVRVWRDLERAGLVAWRKAQRLGKAGELDDGHDGDL